MLGCTASQVIWGTHAPRVLVLAPSPKRSFLFLREVHAGEGAGTSTRGACAPQITESATRRIQRSIRRRSAGLRAITPDTSARRESRGRHVRIRGNRRPDG